MEEKKDDGHGKNGISKMQRHIAGKNIEVRNRILLKTLGHSKFPRKYN